MAVRIPGHTQDHEDEQEIMEIPQFFDIRGDKAGEYLPEVYLFALYPAGENGDILALDQEQLNRDYAHTDELKPVRLPAPNEQIVAKALVSYRKGKWTDVLWIGHSKPMEHALCVSRRVYDVCKAANVQSYRAFPVEPAAPRSGDGLPQGINMPEYIALLPDRGLEVRTSEYFNVTPRRSPFVNSNVRRSKRLIPIPETWKGYDLFRLQEGGTCCTWRVVELARKHHWTNCEFKPLDVRRDMPSEGIDYLGDAWPPEAWYPRPPSEGKTVEQWVNEYMNHARNPLPAREAMGLSAQAIKEHQRARNAIVYDLAAESLPLFVDIVRKGDERDQRISAQMLLNLTAHTRVDTDILANDVLPVFDHNLRQGEPGIGHLIIALNSFIAVPSGTMDLAQKATGKPLMIMPARVSRRAEE
jgi:hypothetical protein